MSEQGAFRLPAIENKPRTASNTFKFEDTDTALRGKPSGAGQALDSVMGAFSGLDPESRMVAKGLIESQMRKQFPGFKFPDPGEAELTALGQEAERIRLKRDIAAGQIDEAYADMATNPGVKTRYGDINKIRENPELFSTVAQELGYKITPGHFALARQEQAGKSSAFVQEEQAAKEAEKEAKAVELVSSELLHTKEIAKRAKEADFPGRAEKALEMVGDAEGIDLTAFDSPIDEPGGANALLKAYKQNLTGVGKNLGKLAVQGFFAVKGNDIADQLEELPRNERGEIVLTPEGTRDVDPKAAYFLAELLSRASKDTSQNISRIMEQAGISASGIDRESLNKMRALYGAEVGESAAEVERGQQGK